MAPGKPRTNRSNPKNTLHFSSPADSVENIPQRYVKQRNSLLQASLIHRGTVQMLLRRILSACFLSVCFPAFSLGTPPDSAKSDESCVEGCDYELLDIHSMFSSVLGDESPLKLLENQTQGDFRYSVGAEARYRYMDERNRLRAGGPGHSDYQLWRLTASAVVNYNDLIGGYIQGIDASMFGLDAPYTTSAIDINGSDLLQCYAELNIGEIGDGTLRYRYGRQFLMYGGQRLVSNLGWGNTFRNFEGHKFLYTSDDWDIDAFTMQSVNWASGAPPRPNSFDHADQSRWLSGVYSTYKGIENSTVDLYYLFFDEQESSAALMDGKRNTLGVRFAGKEPVQDGKTLRGTWNWDLEGDWQFGKDNFGSAAYRDVQAGMLGAIGGYTFEDVTWKPGVGGIFYWASGSQDPTAGNINTFYSMYPLGHAYWGQIDNLSGQNLLNYGVQASAKPIQKLNLVTQWHWFDLAQASDAIYNIAGAALPGSGDRNIGNELDLVGTWTFSKTFNVQLGYLWFFYGDAVSNGPLARPDAEQLYLQATLTY